MDEVIALATEKMNKAIDTMETKFLNIRAGRISPAILEGIKVSYYGVDTPLNSLALITVLDARTLSIKPFDKNTLSNIEKAIFEANIGLTPNNNGETITITVPPLTEERRMDYVKQVKTIAEECRIALRNIRQEANNSIKKLELPEDQEERKLNEIQKLIDEYNKKVDEKFKRKQNELMSM